LFREEEGNVKIARTWILLGVMVTGAIGGRAELRAQPASEPAPADEDRIVIDDQDMPWSQGVPIADRAAARDLFREGNQLIRFLRPAKAVEKYEAALARWKHPAFHYNLALAQRSLDKEVEARASFERALRYGKEGLGEEEYQEAQKQLGELTRQLGRIRVTCRLAGAEVTLDGVTLFTGPGSYEGWAKATGHELTARKTGYMPVARQVTVSPGELQDVDLKLITLSEAADASRRWAVWKPWLVVAVGGAVAAAGGVLHRSASGNFDRFDRRVEQRCTVPEPGLPPGCPKDDPALRELDPILSRAERQRKIVMGSYIAGGSLITAGVLLLYLNRTRLETRGFSDQLAGTVGVIPLVSERTLGVQMTLGY
jgi:tetratricopeptide (TPR) repeat protein